MMCFGGMADRTSRFVRRTSKAFVGRNAVSSKEQSGEGEEMPSSSLQQQETMKTCRYCGILFSKEEADSHRWTFLFIFSLGSSRSCGLCHERATTALNNATGQLGLNSKPKRQKNRELDSLPTCCDSQPVTTLGDDALEVL